MASPASYTDGSPGFGTSIITISGTTYVAENLTINRPVSEAEDFSLIGSPARKRVVALCANGTMTLQVDATTTRPAMGQTFSVTVDAQFGAETFVLKEVGVEQSNDGGTLRKIPVTFDKVISSITVVP